jgi:hypothetical protein
MEKLEQLTIKMRRVRIDKVLHWSGMYKRQLLLSMSCRPK